MERWRILHKTSDYTVIDNGIFKDAELTYAEVGFLCKILSLPEGWHFAVDGIVGTSCEGRDRVYAIIRQLIKHGYCKRTQNKDGKSGRYQSYDYTFYEVKNGLGCDSEPQTGLPDTDTPDTGSPYTETPTHIKYLSNKVLNKSNTKRGSAFAPPTRDQVREFFRERKFNSDPDAFWLHFENCNWKLSSGRGAKMKDWRLAAISWEKRENQFKR